MLVGRVQRAGELFGQGGRRTPFQRATRQPLGQGPAGHVFQRKERLLVRLAHLVDLHDVGMLQAGHRLGLEAKPVQLGAGRLRAASEHLQSDDPLETEVPGLVDDAHAATAQLAQDLVSRHESRFVALRVGTLRRLSAVHRQRIQWCFLRVRDSKQSIHGA